MQKVIDVKYVTSNGGNDKKKIISQLNVMVLSHLKEGWILHGNIVLAGDGYDFHAVQTMVKYEEKPIEEPVTEASLGIRRKTNITS
jgi:hypothetical protein